MEAFREIEKAIEKFATHLVDDIDNDNDDRKGPFFNGRLTPGLVDLTLFPWAWRLPVFKRTEIKGSKSTRENPPAS